MRASLVRLCVGAALLLAPGLASIATAQATAEEKKLEYLAGKWKTDAEIKPSAASPGGKGSGTETCEMFAGRHVVCRAEMTTAAGLYTSMRTISYVPALKQYASYAVDSFGFAVLSLGTVQGSTWTFTSDAGGGVKVRSIMRTSGDSYTMTGEYAGADGKWTTASTGKATRSK